MAKQRRKKGLRLLGEAIAKASPIRVTTTTKTVRSRPIFKTTLAERMGMTVEQLRHIESGRRGPTLAQAVALEDHLKIPIRAWL